MAAERDKEMTPEIPGRNARQGEIILKRPWQRGVFIAGLAGAVVLALLAMLWAWA